MVSRMRKESFPCLSWLVWLGFVLAWTMGLLTSYPIKFGTAVLPLVITFLAAKGLHVAAYALWVVLTGLLRFSIRFRWGLLAFIALHALATEFLQQLVRYRHPSWRDVVLDFLGISLGMTLSWQKWRASFETAVPGNQPGN